MLKFKKVSPRFSPCLSEDDESMDEYHINTLAVSMLRNDLQEKTDHQRSDRPVDHLNKQQPEWIGRLYPHVPEPGIDPDRREQETQQQPPTDPGQAH